jgi:hypothetical protein
MFIGHFAVAFATKKVAPKASLGTLVLAAAFLDVVWPVLVLLGIERFRIVLGGCAFLAAAARAAIQRTAAILTER